jgi:hypothetical protein
VRGGEGELVCGDGTKYVGGWVNDKMHGEGQMFFVNKIFVGFCEDSDDSMDLPPRGFMDQENSRPGLGLRTPDCRAAPLHQTPDFTHQTPDKTSYSNPNNIPTLNLTSNEKNPLPPPSKNPQIKTKKFALPQPTNSIEDSSIKSGLSSEIIAQPIDTGTDPTHTTENTDYIWTYGDMYIGDFKHGKMHGYGGIFCENGDQFFGNFSHGKIHGSGKFLSATGCQYIGMYEGNKKHGKGS